MFGAKKQTDNEANPRTASNRRPRLQQHGLAKQPYCAGISTKYIAPAPRKRSGA
jgi:hypothetical protein